MSGALVKILLLCTAILGVAPAALSQKAKSVDFCALFNAFHSTEGGTVRTEAYMTYSTVARVDGGDSFLYSPHCNNADYFAVTVFATKVSKAAKKFFTTLTGGKNHLLKLTVTGRHRISSIPSFGHLGWSRSQFEIESIERISNVTTDPKLVFPDLKAEAPLTELGSQLRDLNSDILLNLLNGSILEQNKISLHRSFTLSDPNKTLFSTDQLRSLSIEKLFAGNIEGFDRRAVQQPKVEIIGEDYVASGLLWLENATGSKRILEYQNSYRRCANSFVLIKTNLRRVPN